MTTTADVTTTTVQEAPIGTQAAPVAEPKKPDIKVYGSTSGEVIPTGVEPKPPEAAPPAADPKVVGHGGKEIPPDRVAERVKRAERQWMRAHYGTDDPDKVKLVQAQRAKDAEELKALREREAAAEGERKASEREKMTAEQKVEADRKTLQDENAHLREQVELLQVETLTKEQEQVITDAALRHIDPQYVRYAKSDLREHLQGMSDDDAQLFDARQLDRWLRRWSTANPVFARRGVEPQATAPVVAPPAPAPAAPPKKVVPMTSTAPAKAPAPAPRDPNSVNGKTVRPGKNQMNRQELNSFFAARSGGRRVPW